MKKFLILIAGIFAIGIILSSNLISGCSLDYDYRRLHHTNSSSGTITGAFNVFLVNGTSGFNTAAEISEGDMQNDCDDIRIRNTLDNALLNYEIDYGFCNNESTPIWSSGEDIKSDNTTTPYIYYGNSSAGSGENSDEVWKDWIAVFHMNNKTGNSQLYDSSQYHYNLTGIIGSPAYSWDALVGNSVDFESTNNDGWYGSDKAEYDTETLTVLNVFKPESITGDVQWISARYECQTGTCQRTWVMAINGTGHLYWAACENINGCSSISYADSPLTVGTWYCAIGTTNATDGTLYLWNENGVGGLNATDPLPNAVDSSSADLTIGYQKWSGEDKHWFDGKIDEVWFTDKTATEDDARHLCEQFVGNVNSIGAEEVLVCSPSPSLEERVEQLEQENEILKQQIQNNTQRINALEILVNTLQETINEIQQTLNNIIGDISAYVGNYLSNLPNGLRRQMICGAMEQTNITNSTGFGLYCEIDGESCKCDNL